VVLHKGGRADAAARCAGTGKSGALMNCVSRTPPAHKAHYAEAGAKERERGREGRFSNL
jgi:hypothetical protein